MRSFRLPRFSAPLAVALAIAACLVPRIASAQQCPASSAGQACNGGAGLCVASTCSYYDGGVSVPTPCAFCEPVACPAAEVGQPCEGGTCTAATCRGPDAGPDGGCTICASPPTNACAPADTGKPCGDGGVCTMMLNRLLGPAGAPPPSDLFYPTWVCYVAPPPGPCCVDAGAGLSVGGDDAGGSPHATEADAGSLGATAGGASNGGGGGGCDVSTGAASLSGAVLLLCAGGALKRRRRLPRRARDLRA